MLKQKTDPYDILETTSPGVFMNWKQDSER